MREDYKIILVDDEDGFRGRIASFIQEGSGFQVIGSTSNGYDALDLVEKLHPDVVITDIRMPFIDGIELAKILRRDFPTINLVFISGYDEFDYAREAIELDVFTYLMKPVTAEDISSFLAKLKIKLDNEYDKLFSEEKLKNDYIKSVPLLIEQQLNSFLRLRELSNDDLDKLRVHGIDVNDSEYVIGLIEINEEKNFLEAMKLRVFLRNLISSTFEHYNFAYSFSTIDGLGFIIKNNILNIRELENVLYEFILKKKEYSSLKIKIGLSTIFEKFNRFPEKYMEAKKTLSLSRFVNVGQVVFYNDIKDKETQDIKLSLEDIKELDYIFRFGSTKEINDLFNNLIMENGSNTQFVNNHQFYIVSISNIILNYAESLNLDIRKVIDGDFIDKLFAYTDIEQMFEYTKEIVLKLRKENLALSISRTIDITNKVVKFIEKSYNNPEITLEMVSDEFGISISYLSMLLKKEKGIKFNKYLIKVRMEKAMELLKYTNDKIITIAKQTGYNEVYYFSHSFKKFTGTSPKEYRNNEKN